MALPAGLSPFVAVDAAPLALRGAGARTPARGRVRAGGRPPLESRPVAARGAADEDPVRAVHGEGRALLAAALLAARRARGLLRAPRRGGPGSARHSPAPRP